MRKLIVRTVARAVIVIITAALVAVCVVAGLTMLHMFFCFQCSRPRLGEEVQLIVFLPQASVEWALQAIVHVAIGAVYLVLGMAVLLAIAAALMGVALWLFKLADWLPEEGKAKNEGKLEPTGSGEFMVADDGEIVELEASS